MPPLIDGDRRLIVDDRTLAQHCPYVLAVTGCNTSSNEFVSVADARVAAQYLTLYVTKSDESETSVVEAALAMANRAAERERLGGAAINRVDPAEMRAAAAAERPDDNINMPPRDANQPPRQAQREEGVGLVQLVNLMLGGQSLAATLGLYAAFCSSGTVGNQRGWNVDAWGASLLYEDSLRTEDRLTRKVIEIAGRQQQQQQQEPQEPREGGDDDDAAQQPQRDHGRPIIDECIREGYPDELDAIAQPVYIFRSAEGVDEARDVSPAQAYACRPKSCARLSMLEFSMFASVEAHKLPKEKPAGEEQNGAEDGAPPDDRPLFAPDGHPLNRYVDNHANRRDTNATAGRERNEPNDFKCGPLAGTHFVVPKSGFGFPMLGGNPPPSLPPEGAENVELAAAKCEVFAMYWSLLVCADCTPICDPATGEVVDVEGFAGVGKRLALWRPLTFAELEQRVGDFISSTATTPLANCRRAIGRYIINCAYSMRKLPIERKLLNMYRAKHVDNIVDATKNGTLVNADGRKAARQEIAAAKRRKNISDQVMFTNDFLKAPPTAGNPEALSECCREHIADCAAVAAKLREEFVEGDPRLARRLRELTDGIVTDSRAVVVNMAAFNDYIATFVEDTTEPQEAEERGERCRGCSCRCSWRAWRAWCCSWSWSRRCSADARRPRRSRSRSRSRRRRRTTAAPTERR